MAICAVLLPNNGRLGDLSFSRGKRPAELPDASHPMALECGFQCLTYEAETETSASGCSEVGSCAD